MTSRAGVQSGPAPTNVGSAGACNGVLRMFLLALDVREGPSPTRVEPVLAVEPFLPARIGPRPRTERGVRPAVLLAYRHRSEAGAELTFGAATAAMRSGEPGVRPYVGPAATCLSLWEVPDNGLVLALESLSDVPDTTLVGWNTDPLQDRDGAGFRPAVDAFLTVFGLDSDASLVDLFPGLHTRLSDPAVHRPLTDVVVHSHRGIGDQEAIEGLVVEVTADGADRVRGLVEGPQTGPLARAAAGRWGVLWHWDRVSLVDQPVEPGATVAVREDSAAVLLDLEATARGHDYVGSGTREMLYCLLPWVAIRARCSMDFWQVLDHLRCREDLTGDRLVQALDDVAAMQARRMERALLRKEHQRDNRYHSWTQPTQLRSILVRRAAEETEELDIELAEAVRVIEHGLLRSAELRGARHSRLANAWSVLAGVIAAVALFAALAAIPATTEPTLFTHWAYALTATTVMMGSVVAAAVLWRRR
ncbi:hypothetical protein ACWDUM_11735 [Rhodococcus sp. NPDC003322]